MTAATDFQGGGHVVLHKTPLQRIEATHPKNTHPMFRSGPALAHIKKPKYDTATQSDAGGVMYRT